jgi:RNA polymerase sigma-70 factor (ECF subfamily)
MDTTATTLLERLRHPQADAAWSRFVALYTPLLYDYALRRGVPPSDASDLLQDVFVVVVEKMPEFTHDAKRSFRRWLHTVLLNKWRDRQRRAVHQPQAMDAAHLPEPAANDDPAEMLGEAEYQQQVVARALQLMQDEFEPKTWQACWQSAVCGRPAAEVAAELGISVNAVYLATSRVLRRLRQELAGLLD